MHNLRLIEEVFVRNTCVRLLVAGMFCAVSAAALTARQATVPTKVAGLEGPSEVVKPFVVNEWAQPLAAPDPPAPAFKAAGQTVDGSPVPPPKPWGHADIEGIWLKRQGVPGGSNVAYQTQPLPFTAEGLKAFNSTAVTVDPTGKCMMPG